MSLFGTSGIRCSAEELTNQFCFDAGRAFAKFLSSHGKEGKVAVGMDPRESGPRIKKAFSAGVEEEGYKVVDQGIVPTPAINYILISSPSFAGSCIVTGSHVKRGFNGLKFFAFKEEILKEHEAEIEEIYDKIKEKIGFSDKKLKLEKSREAREEYEKMMRELSEGPYPKWKVVVDGCNGTQSKIFPRVLEDLGLEVTTINDSLDPKDFLARDTETEGAVKELQEKVVEENADFGIAFDGDGDRVIFVDDNGEFIPGDYTGSLIAKYNSSPNVVTPINTSQVVERIGKEVIRTKVGSPFVVKAMKEHNSEFGFEANGGGISADVMLSRDGGSTAIKILNLVKSSGKTFGELMDELPKFYLYRTKVDCPRRLNSKIINGAKKKYSDKRVEEVDGVKVWMNDSSWVLFRPSNNAPEFRVFAEAKTESDARELGREGIKFVNSFIE